MRRRWLGAWMILSSGVCACDPSGVDGRPIALDDLCAEVATVLCRADATCCARSGPDDDCATTQRAACAETLGVLASDRRVGYVPERGGAFVDRLSSRVGTCGETPLRASDLAILFEGTGGAGADCTPRVEGGRITARELRAVQSSCAEGRACRIYLGADGGPQGVCEPRAATDDGACSHALDCPDGTYCNLASDAPIGAWGRCQPRRVDGWACADDRECEGGRCGEGVCGVRDGLDLCLAEDYPAVVLDGEPLVYLRLDETSGTTARDASGNGATARYVGMVTRRTDGAVSAGSGDDGASITLAGDGGAIELSPLDGLATSDAVTIELWVERPAMGDAGPLVSMVDGDTTVELVLERGRLTARAVSPGVDMPVELRSDAGAVGEGFHHVALVVDADAVRLFVDGAMAAEHVGAVVWPRAASIVVGRGLTPAMGSAPSMTGSLDEVAIHARALGAAAFARRLATKAGPVAHDAPLVGWLR